MDHVAGKAIIITGAASGFGRLAALRLARRGARIVCADIDGDGAARTASEVEAGGGTALAVRVDVSRLADMQAAATRAIDGFGAIDVLVNNAGVMPLAFLADHEKAHEAWNRCIDINFKGVVNGTCAVHDQMIRQGRGQIVNMSSIFGNIPVMGGAIYGATKAAVDHFSHSVRQESRGRIKVTVIKPTGVSSTNLGASVVNAAAAVGALGPNYPEYRVFLDSLAAGTTPAEQSDPEAIAYASLAPEYIVDAIVHAIDQPWGVAISDITVRAAGDYFVM